MHLYLCVDCGGSKTAAAICDSSGVVVGRGLGGPSNFSSLDAAVFVSAVRHTIDEALQETPSDGRESKGSYDFAAAWFGVSGVDSPAGVASVTPLLSSLVGIPPGPRLVITNDTHLLAAPLRLYPDASFAVVCIAGTGSISASFKETNGTLEELGRIGGWGWMLGDDGGGYDVGRAALRELLFQNDHELIAGPPNVFLTHPGRDSLKKRVLAHFGVDDIRDVLRIVHLSDTAPDASSAHETPAYLSMPREKRLSSLCPIVFSAWLEDGDPFAGLVLSKCASALATQTAMLLRLPGGEAMDQTNTVKAEDSVLCIGGSLLAVESYRLMVLQMLNQEGHVFRYVHVIDDAAAVGAFNLATARANVELQSD